MIKHHPKQQLLQGFVSGELTASLSAAIAIHADMCPCCQAKIAQMMETQAAQSFAETDLAQFTFDDVIVSNDIEPINFDAMIDAIVADEQVASLPVRHEQSITIADKQYILPQAIENVELSHFTHLGKLSRARFKFAEGEVHSSLLQIQPGGSVPEHTHKGYELTLLLEGEFSDEQGHYVPGDFMMLDGTNTHKPYSDKGCLCFTVVNQPLHFTQGINRLLNPIGTFIY